MLMRSLIPSTRRTSLEPLQTSKVRPGGPSWRIVVLTSRRYVVHSGFQDTFKRLASPALAAVKRAVAERGTNNLTLVGHSLGGAISTLNHLFFKIQLPSLNIKSVLYGVPRVRRFASLP